MRMRLLLLTVLSASLMTACGFHLRGKLPLPEQLSVIAVESKETAVRGALISALRTSGATVVADRGSAKAVLDLFQVDFERKVRTIDTRGKVTSYTLTYTVRYKVTSADGKELRKSAPITMRRDYNFDPEQVLQKEDEEQSLREDMEEQLSQQILRQLVTIASLAPTNLPGVRGV